jgi:cell division protein FtsI/penicillin-binding protein 2
MLWPSQNNARNAIKGSCNIYFSHLAERIELRTLQAWFSKFGYGRVMPLTRPLEFSMAEEFDLRTLGQASGRIIADAGNRKLAGIGQSNMRVTPLQVANSMATLARRGQFLNPTLFQMNTNHTAASHTPENLGISEGVMDVVLDGMDAVVNEVHGSAHTAFQEADQEVDFSRYGVHVYGKTGSTESPENAWFAGFARDKSGRVLAIAVVVEGGQSGGKDAAPLALDILDLCIQQGYLGTL